MKIVITANSNSYPAGHPNETRKDPQSSDNVALFIQAKYGLFSEFAKRNMANMVNLVLNGASDDEITTFVINSLKEEIIDGKWPIEGVPTKRAQRGFGAMGKGTRKSTSSFVDTKTMLDALGAKVERSRDVS